MIAVLFEAVILPGQQPRYLALAADLKPLLAEADGFIAIERFQSLATPDKLLSLSWWRDEDAVLRWKQNEQHQAAQNEGRASIFAAYRISIVGLLRDYSFESKELCDV